MFLKKENMTEESPQKLSPNSPFMTCSKCGYTWQTRDQFLDDPTIKIIGFQADIETPENSLYLFNHDLADDSCGSTIAIFVSHFLDMYDGPIYDEVIFGSETCSGHCARIDDMELCKNPCRNAVAREIMIQILERQSGHKETV